ncbi:MAG: beta-N-acetylhexosaminidase [Hyphomicrobiaceae bacterium]|nr:beta-N-acetylhexosaminidase [Hyphomicrobiaceae bacterium]
MSARAALITGLAGLKLSGEERAFLAETRPAGIILFARNLESHDQIRRLVTDARDAIGDERVLVLIDQEGGRVQRLRPPLGRALPPASAYASLHAIDPEAASRAAWLVARLLADDLTALGINTDCAPVLDLPVAGAHEIIGDRAYGRTVGSVVALGRVVAEGFMAGGVIPVIKHIPGHGRATADSHLSLPVVTTPRAELEATDFAPFKALRGMPTAMTAHVVFSDLDPAHPASTSGLVTAEIIRGHIGFDGLLMSDDLGMQALTGTMRHRAEAVISAGSDVALHCSGNLAEMRDAAAGVPVLGGDAERRFETAMRICRNRTAFDEQAALAALDRVLAHHAASAESV